jgi:hypothetical protein
VARHDRVLSDSALPWSASWILVPGSTSKRAHFARFESAARDTFLINTPTRRVRTGHSGKQDAIGHGHCTYVFSMLALPHF